jgi:hypothetical protein
MIGATSLAVMSFVGRAKTANWNSSKMTDVFTELLPWMFVAGVVPEVSVTPSAGPAAVVSTTIGGSGGCVSSSESQPVMKSAVTSSGRT